MGIEEQFHEAVKYVQTAPGSQSNETKLKFYAYFKQATEGPNKTKEPSRLNMVARMKWDAWKKLGNMPKEDAMKGYIAELGTVDKQYKSKL
eukprot:TRINITY_DN59850_c0_g1_i1.p1 TRINITY_DN59850_c0_g1~~TRINITY_DN59850_c0_g1_i1.p1  ORF type:complete len:100 (-),score=18.74 TRINITY_DN59850_c0_g1_i1:1-273(-)